MALSINILKINKKEQTNMLTKEELLEKGLSDEVADEVIASFSDENEDPLQALNKAINDEPEMDTLFKADEGEAKKSEKEDEDDDYDEKFMKKHMKRYMKENKKSCGEDAKEAGIFGDEMKKAIDEFDTDSEGAVIEMTDLKPILEQFGTAIETMSKAIPELASRVDLISAQHDESFDVLKKAAKVTALQAESLGSFLETPTGRKGVVASADMMKAQTVAVDRNKQVHEVLLKAVKEKDLKAGEIIGMFESAGHQYQALTKADKEYISNLLIKSEVK